MEENWQIYQVLVYWVQLYFFETSDCREKAGRIKKNGSPIKYTSTIVKILIETLMEEIKFIVIEKWLSECQEKTLQSSLSRYAWLKEFWYKEKTKTSPMKQLGMGRKFSIEI